MNYRKYILPVLALLLGLHASAQSDSLLVRHVVDTLTTPWFRGRGYLDNGMGKAATYLEQAFRSAGLQPLEGKNFLQPFTYSVNTFPGKTELFVNGRRLEPGVHYIPSPDSRGVKAKGRLIQQDSTHFINPENRLLVVLEKKLTWSVSQKAADYTAILADSSLFRNGAPETIELDLENKVINRFTTANICGMVRGTTYPDSVIFITAHYDHLGGLGKDAYFPGANDNAGGVGLLLALARYYSTHPQPYSIGFICFAGEEIGLLGSKYYTEHPIVPLKNIHFLINLDLVGTGDEGITVVNATEYKEPFAALQQLNEQHHYLAAVNARGKAANSDHYWFSEKGVPAFFLYTMGGIKAYHDVFDKAATLPLNEINDLSSLLKDFIGKLQ